MQTESSGRLPALTVEKQRRLIELVAGGMTLSRAAARVGCSEKTVKRERKQSPLLDHLLTEARRWRLPWGALPAMARRKRATSGLLMRPRKPDGGRPANPANVARLLRMLTQRRG